MPLTVNDFRNVSNKRQALLAGPDGTIRVVEAKLGRKRRAVGLLDNSQKYGNAAERQENADLKLAFKEVFSKYVGYEVAQILTSQHSLSNWEKSNRPLTGRMIKLLIDSADKHNAIRDMYKGLIVGDGSGVYCFRILKAIIYNNELGPNAGEDQVADLAAKYTALFTSGVSGGDFQKIHTASARLGNDITLSKSQNARRFLLLKQLPLVRELTRYIGALIAALPPRLFLSR